ncbi:nuclear transport factor 2 family protein [Nocardia sp. NPDC051756]|uniref:nuclear transport factor 2 family protein n=1 Tax=Nocardia sp. NPDC051756 TaxID=3154751 RepID=UPI003449AD81
MTDVNYLADRVAVTEAVARFAWSQDLEDWDGLRAILADTVTMDVSEHLGAPSQELSADDFVAASRAVREGFQSTHHSTSNVIVEIEGDHAGYRSFVVAYHHVPADAVDWLVARAFWYVDLQRVDNEWRLRRIRVVRKAPFAGNPELYAIAAGTADKWARNEYIDRRSARRSISDGRGDVRA